MDLEFNTIMSHQHDNNGSEKPKNQNKTRDFCKLK